MGDADAWTVLRLLGWTKDYLSRAGVDAPRLSAEVLLAHALGCTRIDLYTRYAYTPTAEERAVFRELVLRAARHEPIAYLVGEKEFYSLRFRITPDVLVPRPETELLVAEAIGHLRRALPLGGGPVGGRFAAEPLRLWDVCTGCGCVAVAVAAHVAETAVLATDVSEAAVAVAGENAASHGLAGRVRCRVADLLALPPDCEDWAEVDAITANPPYVATGGPGGAPPPVAESVRREPAIALYAGRDGLDVIRRLIGQAPGRLRAGGALVLEFGYDQADAVRNLLVARGTFAEPRILRDPQHIERVAVAVRKS